MSKVDIWMPIFIGDYLRDTAELSDAEHGAYLLLLMHYWQKNGEMGSDVERLARVARTQIETARFILGSYFVLEDGNYKNKRADIEMANAENRRTSARENGLKGGRPPSNNPQKTDGLTDGLPDANRGGNPQESSSPSPSSSYSEEKKEERVEFFHLSQKPIPIQNDGTSRIERARAAWNGLAPLIGPECRLMAIQFKRDDLDDCLRIMSVYSDDEIAEAIQNYCNLKTDSEYDPPRYGGFVGFMRGGVEKFVTSANPQDIFKKRKGFETAGEREDRERAEALRRLGVEP